jgi:hypothetical protein
MQTAWRVVLFLPKNLNHSGSEPVFGMRFHQLSLPQPGGGQRLRTFKNSDEAKIPFHRAGRDQPLYSLEEEARRYVQREAPK